MKKVVMTPNPYRDRDFSCVLEAQRILSAAGVDAKICLAFEVDKSFALPQGVPLFDLQEELRTADALICFGGDGTILHTSKAAARHGIPILGVNIGTVGFMAELESGEMALLSRLATDDYQIDERMTLYVRLLHEGRVIYRDVALNDAVITKGAVARVIQPSVWLDGVKAMSFSGDGIIAATPTGSTAYSMAAGGPIVEPTAENLLLTPMCAHSLTAKPYVLAGDRHTSVKLLRGDRDEAVLLVDGEDCCTLQTGDLVYVRKSSYVTRLIKLRKLSFYDIVRHKLN